MTRKAGAASVREQFVRTIESQILSGERKIGDRLPSARELCKLLDVSLTTVNTGLGELAAKGFVEIVPRQGVFVADYLQRGTPEALISLIRFHGGRLGAAEVRNFCEARMAIDPSIAEWVIRRATEEQLDELGELLGNTAAAQITMRPASASRAFSTACTSSPATASSRSSTTPPSRTRSLCTRPSWPKTAETTSRKTPRKSTVSSETATSPPPDNASSTPCICPSRAKPRLSDAELFDSIAALRRIR